MRIDFSSPWSTGVKLLTAAGVTLLVLAPFFGPGWVALVLLGAIATCALLTVRGYHIEHDHLLVRRLGWSTRIDVRSVRRAEADPLAMKGSLRLFGNGGIFGFVGWFRNSRLGWYSAYATDPRRAVVLELEGSRRVVLTPDDPQQFLRAVAAARGRT